MQQWFLFPLLFFAALINSLTLLVFRLSREADISKVARVSIPQRNRNSSTGTDTHYNYGFISLNLKPHSDDV
jgi:hypothetical protein